jgi:hypothetical protein
MANEEVERLHVYTPSYDLWYFFTGLYPHEIILEYELFTPKKVIITVDSLIASKAFLLDS